jgi:hypothetical protein
MYSFLKPVTNIRTILHRGKQHSPRCTHLYVTRVPWNSLWAACTQIRTQHLVLQVHTSHPKWEVRPDTRYMRFSHWTFNLAPFCAPTPFCAIAIAIIVPTEESRVITEVGGVNHCLIKIKLPVILDGLSGIKSTIDQILWEYNGSVHHLFIRLYFEKGLH